MCSYSHGVTSTRAHATLHGIYWVVMLVSNFVTFGSDTVVDCWINGFPTNSHTLVQVPPASTLLMIMWISFDEWAISKLCPGRSLVSACGSHLPFQCCCDVRKTGHLLETPEETAPPPERREWILLQSQHQLSLSKEEYSHVDDLGSD